MTLDETMKLLASKGTDQKRKTYKRHGAPEPMFGVKIGDLKPIVKLIKGDQALALQLYATGNSDAMYLAGLVADGSTSYNNTMLCSSCVNWPGNAQT